MHFAPGPGLAPISPLTPLSPITPPALIPIQDWQRHTRRETRPADFHLRLPDGTPLRLTASGIDLWERITGGGWYVETFHHASILLWCATRTPEQLLALWTPAPPEDTADGRTEATGEEILPIFRPDARLRDAIIWRDAVIPAGARQEVLLIAIALWAHEHANLLEIDEASLDDDNDGQKKSTFPAPTGSSAPSTPSAAETPPAGPPSSPSHTPTSSAPTEHGSSPAASPSSPPPPAAGETSESISSSPSADQCPYCIPGVDHCTHTPADIAAAEDLPSASPHTIRPGIPFWVAELRHPIGNAQVSYASTAPATAGQCYVPVTTDIHKALTFPDHSTASAWIASQSTPGYWIATDHICQ